MDKYKYIISYTNYNVERYDEYENEIYTSDVGCIVGYIFNTMDDANKYIQDRISKIEHTDVKNNVTNDQWYVYYSDNNYTHIMIHTIRPYNKKSQHFSRIYGVIEKDNKKLNNGGF